MAHRLTNLIAAREQRNWTQQDLADRLEVTKQTIGRWERCLFLPPSSMQKRVASLFQIPADSLFATYEEGSPAPTPHAQIPFSSDLTMTTSTTQTSSSQILDPGIPLAPHATFVGREKELTALKARLLTGNSVALTALNGLPGVGKTSLTITLAHDPDILSHFQDGVLWAGLGPQPNILGIFHHWGSLLGLSEAEIASLHDIASWGKALHRAIGTRSMLLVIDDVWTPEAGLAFKIGGPNCAYLLTTRYPHLANAIAPDAAFQLEELSEQESFTLLRFLAPAASREHERIHELIRAVGGLPLALTLIGNYLRRQTYSGQTRRIVSAFDYLSNPDARLGLQEPRAPVETHTSIPTNATLSLETVIRASDQQLPEEASRVLYALSIFPSKPQSFSEEAALIVTDCEVDALDMLVDTGLLSLFGERLTLHQTIHDYAQKKLLQTGQKEQIARRFVRYVAQFVSTHKEDTVALEQESEIIFEVLDLAQKLQMLDDLTTIILATATFFLQIGLYSKAETYLRVAIAQPQPGKLASLLFFLARAIQAQGAFQEARDTLLRGLQLAREANDLRAIIDCLSQLGWLLPKMGSYEDAVPYLQEGLTLAREQDEKERTCRLLKALGSVYDFLGQYEAAQESFEEAYHIACEINDTELICVAKINMGANAGILGYEQLAEQHLRDALALAKKIGLVEAQCVTLINLGEMHNQRGSIQDLDEAPVYLHECLSLAQQAGILEWQTVAILILGSVSCKQGRFDQAEAYFEECLALAQQLGIAGRHRILAQIYTERSANALARGNLQEAEKLLSQAWEACPERDQEVAALIYFGQAKCAAASGALTQAKKYGEKCLQILQRTQHGWVSRVVKWLEQLDS